MGCIPIRIKPGDGVVSAISVRSEGESVFSHRIHRGPAGREGIIHPRTEVEQAEVQGAIVSAIRGKGVGHEATQSLFLLGSITPAVLPGHRGEGRVIDSRAVRQVITLLQDLRYRLAFRNVDHRADVAQMVPGVPAVRRVRVQEEDPLLVPGYALRYVYPGGVRHEDERPVVQPPREVPFAQRGRDRRPVAEPGICQRASIVSVVHPCTRDQVQEIPAQIPTCPGVRAFGGYSLPPHSHNMSREKRLTKKSS